MTDLYEHTNGNDVAALYEALGVWLDEVAA